MQSTHGKKYGALTEPVRRKRWNLIEKKIQENNLQVAAGKVTYRLRHSRFSDYVGTYFDAGNFLWNKYNYYDQDKKELKKLTGLVLPSSAELELLESQAANFVPTFKQTNPIPATVYIHNLLNSTTIYSIKFTSSLNIRLISVSRNVCRLLKTKVHAEAVGLSLLQVSIWFYTFFFPLM